MEFSIYKGFGFFGKKIKKIKKMIVSNAWRKNHALYFLDEKTQKEMKNKKKKKTTKIFQKTEKKEKTKKSADIKKIKKILMRSISLRVISSYQTRILRAA
jgi:hypothetical protein